MARVDVLELKSFQKISLNEVRYLSEIDLIKCQPARAEEAPKKALTKEHTNFANVLKLQFNALSRAFKSAVNSILYETVPHCDTYSPE
ncbi:MAG: hypothetical protein WC028_20745 [Candidatus Obscuribacterales bacterium]